MAHVIMWGHEVIDGSWLKAEAFFSPNTQFCLVTDCSWVAAWQNMVWHKRLYKTEVRPQTIAVIDILFCFMNVYGDQRLNEITDGLWVMHFSSEKSSVSEKQHLQQSKMDNVFLTTTFCLFFSWKRVFFGRVFLILVCSCFWFSLK